MIPFEVVLDRLERYHQYKERLTDLEFDIATLSGTTPDEVIEALTFAKVQGERVQTSSHGDPTAHIAMVYRKIAESEQAALIDPIRREYESLKQELRILDFALERLSERSSSILVGMYIENRSTWQDMCEERNIAMSTLGRQRTKAVKELQVFLEGLQCAKNVFKARSNPPPSASPSHLKNPG